jgi:hypothetical protein
MGIQLLGQVFKKARLTFGFRDCDSLFSLFLIYDRFYLSLELFFEIRVFGIFIKPVKYIGYLLRIRWQWLLALRLWKAVGLILYFLIWTRSLNFLLFGTTSCQFFTLIRYIFIRIQWKQFHRLPTLSLFTRYFLIADLRVLRLWDNYFVWRVVASILLSRNERDVSSEFFILIRHNCLIQLA